MPTVFYDCRVKTAHLLSSSLSRIKNVFDDLKRTKKLNRSTLTDYSWAAAQHHTRAVDPESHLWGTNVSKAESMSAVLP